MEEEVETEREFVYIVTTGEGVENHIVGVYSNSVMANRCAKQQRSSKLTYHNKNVNVDKWEIDH